MNDIVAKLQKIAKQIISWKVTNLPQIFDFEADFNFPTFENCIDEIVGFLDLIKRDIGRSDIRTQQDFKNIKLDDKTAPVTADLWKVLKVIQKMIPIISRVDIPRAKELQQIGERWKNILTAFARFERSFDWKEGSSHPAKIEGLEPFKFEKDSDVSKIASELKKSFEGFKKTDLQRAAEIMEHWQNFITKYKKDQREKRRRKQPIDKP